MPLKKTPATTKKQVRPKKPVKKEPKFKIDQAPSVTSKNGKVTKTTTTYTLNSGKNISYKDTREIYQRYLDEGIESEKIYITVMAHRYLTLKSLYETEFKDWDSEEYYENRVMDPSEFLNNFQFVQVTILD